jgi:hypothetical protein|eukprot:6829313-Prymnesium_polylepis.3
MMIAGEVGVRRSGAILTPLSSGWNLWHAARVPMSFGRRSPRCMQRSEIALTHQHSTGSWAGR